MEISDLTLLGITCVAVGGYALWLDAQLDRARLMILKAREIIDAIADGEVEVYRADGDIKMRKAQNGRAGQAVN
jgi:hypothetical protein